MPSSSQKSSTSTDAQTAAAAADLLRNVGRTQVLIVASIRKKDGSQWFVLPRTVDLHIPMREGFHSVLDSCIEYLNVNPEVPMEFRFKIVPDYLQQIYDINPDEQFWRMVLLNATAGAGRNCYLVNINVDVEC